MGLASKTLKTIAEKFFDARIYRAAGLPHGVDCFTDIRRDFPRLDVACVVDVGANVGQSARVFAKQFPQATIHSLEPVSTTFRKLCAETAYEPRIKPYQIALGEQNTRLAMATQPESVLSSLASTDLMSGEAIEEFVEVQTLDRFTADRGISHIHVLKIDVEGYEMQVLHGASRMLDTGAIDLIHLEFGFGVTAAHVSLDGLIVSLAPHDYHVYGIYDQSPDWRPNASRRLMYANVMFARTQPPPHRS